MFRCSNLRFLEIDSLILLLHSTYALTFIFARDPVTYYIFAMTDSFRKTSET